MIQNQYSVGSNPTSATMDKERKMMVLLEPYQEKYWRAWCPFLGQINSECFGLTKEEALEKMRWTLSKRFEGHSMYENFECIDF